MSDLLPPTSQPDPAVQPVPSAHPIHTRNLSMRFGRDLVLDDLSLSIPRGAIYALVGPNGAGKTTLIKLLLNIFRPTSGTATILGQPSTSITGKALTQIAYVSENQELPEWMTVDQLLRYLRPFYPQWDLTLEQQLIAQFDLPVDRRLKHLSRGQRMKAALLSVLPYRPSLIVLDEPFSGLDPLVRDELAEGLLDRAAQGGTDAPTILVSSHDLAEIETLATHIGFLDRGRLLFSEESSTLTNRFREVVVTLGLAPGQLPPRDPSAFPSSWLLPELSPSVLHFIHAQADTEPVEEQVRRIFPNALAVDLEPLSLRAIFLALAKSARSPTNYQTSPPEASSPRSRA